MIIKEQNRISVRRLLVSLFALVLLIILQIIAPAMAGFLWQKVSAIIIFIHPSFSSIFVSSR